MQSLHLLHTLTQPLSSYISNTPFNVDVKSFFRKAVFQVILQPGNPLQPGICALAIASSQKTYSQEAHKAPKASRCPCVFYIKVGSV
jgi:hypothetical protein